MSDAPRPDHTGLLSLEGVADGLAVSDPRDTELVVLRDLGKGLVNYFFMSLRTLSIHSADNAAVEEPLERLHGVLDELSRNVHRTHFITVEGQVYLNDLRIRTDASAFNNLSYLVGQLERHGIGGVTFNAVPPVEQLKALLLVLLKTRPPKDGDALDHIRLALDESEVEGVEFDRPYYFKSGEGNVPVMQEGEAAEQEHAALSYAKGVLAVKDYFRAVEAAETANPLRIRKIVHDLVDVAQDDPRDFLKLHTIHGVEDPYYNHCVNVTALAVAIGRELGLTRVLLADLGAAAMFHDLGYAAVERWSEDEGRETTADERMREHPIAGFRTLLKAGEYGPGLLRRMLVTLEHHMSYKRPGGYPNLGRKRLSVFTRIVQVADYYDALVTPAGEHEPLLPVKALERIVANKDAVFDPVCVKALINVVGRHPYGSLVQLSSGEVGVVTSGGRSSEEFGRPIVMIVRNADGSECEPRELDLAVDRVLKRRVAAVLDPFTEGVTPHAVLFDQLGEEEEEEEEAPDEAGLGSEAWNRAIWEGDDTRALVEGDVAAAGGADPGRDLVVPDWLKAMDSLPDAAEPNPIDDAPSRDEWGFADEAEAPVEAAVADESEAPAEAAVIDEAEATVEEPGPPEWMRTLEEIDAAEDAEDVAEVTSEVPVVHEFADPEPAAEPPPPPAAFDPWGFGAVADGGDGDLGEELGFAPDPAAHRDAEVSPLTEPWEVDEAAETNLGGDHTAELPDAAGVTAQSPEAPSLNDNFTASDSSSPQVSVDEATGTGDAASQTAESPATGAAAHVDPATQHPDDAPPTHPRPDEIAERKAAWKKALAQAYAKGGEAAVRSLASKTWYNFDQ